MSSPFFPNGGGNYDPDDLSWSKISAVKPNGKLLETEAALAAAVSISAPSGIEQVGPQQVCLFATDTSGAVWMTQGTVNIENQQIPPPPPHIHGQKRKTRV